MFRKSFQLPIARRLPVVMFTMSCLIALMGGLLYFQTYQNSIESIEATVEFVAKDETLKVKTWYETNTREIALVASQDATASAILHLKTALEDDGGSMKPAQNAYASGNPHKLGTRQELVDAGDGSAFSSVHRDIHPRFDKVRQTLGFYDMFLFDTEGNVLYTVVKEADFGENFISGSYSNTGLGTAYRAALQGKRDSVIVADFEAYAPSADAPAAFFATPVFGPDGKAVGVLAAQLSVEALSTSLHSAGLLGEKGDIYLVGSDGRARTRSRFDGGFVEFDALPDRPFVVDLKTGKTGMYFDVDGVSGNSSIVFTQPIQLAFGTWTLALELDKDELLAGMTSLRNRIFVFVGIGIVGGIGLGFLSSRSVTIPLSSVLKSIQKVAGGDYISEVAVANRKDEIGDLGRAVVDFRDKLAAATELEAKRTRDFNAQEMVTAKMTAALAALADGDLTQSLSERFPYGFEPMRINFNKTITTLRDMVHEMALDAD